jgi:ketosteroid isomerase-like protein
MPTSSDSVYRAVSHLSPDRDKHARRCEPVVPGKEEPDTRRGPGQRSRWLTVGGRDIDGSGGVLDKVQVDDWLERYVAAWKSYDRDAIDELFSEDIEYRYHPYDDEAVRGREAVVQDWLEDRDEPGRYDAIYRTQAVDGDVAVATGTSSYFDADGAVEKIYYNCFIMRFDDSERCREFTEWFMLLPKD